MVGIVRNRRDVFFERVQSAARGPNAALLLENFLRRFEYLVVIIDS